VHRRQKILSPIKYIDCFGAILNAATFSLFVVASTYSGFQWPWGSGQVITPWVITGVVVMLYVLQQRGALLTTKGDRIFPVWCLKSRSLVLVFIGTAGCSVVNSFNFSNIYYIYLFFEPIKGDDAIEVASRLLPFVFLLIFSAMFSGVLLPKLNLYAAWYVVSGSLTLVESVLMFSTSLATSVRNIYGFEISIGAG
jgi:hypothetical protein